MEKEPIKEKELPPCEITKRCKECLFKWLCIEEYLSDEEIKKIKG